jgi:lysophospholipase L1-like esterase
MRLDPRSWKIPPFSQWRSHLWPLLGALALSFGVLSNTLLVSAHNLGAREDIGYINGGKIFRLKGTMWYHIPGLTEIGLAPQNIGAQINLRNNEYAMFQQRLKTVTLVDVDFSLEENAQLYVALNYKDHTSNPEDEGTFWAARLTSFPDAENPLVNALVRYEHGRVTERVELDKFGRSLAPGPHRFTVEINKNGTLTATLDGTAQNVPFQIDVTDPYVALGSGEQNTTITRWRVVGTNERNQEVDWEETFSIWSTIKHRLRAIVGLSMLIWLILFGLPIAKVAIESKRNPVMLIPACITRSTPLLILGILCLLPWMPLLFQWILSGLFVVYVWMSLWEHLEAGPWKLNVPVLDDDTPVTADGNTSEAAETRTPSPRRESLRWIVAALVLITVGGALYGVRTMWRASIIETEIPTDHAVNKEVLAKQPAISSLKLGQRIELKLPDVADEAAEGDDAKGLPDTRLAFRVQLGPNEILRVDLMQALPPKVNDVYQVDRSNSPDGGDQQDFELKAISTFVSSTAGLPSELRRLHSDKVSRSPHGGWTLEPKEYEVVISCRPPIAQVTVDGKLMDYRTDLSRKFRIGGVQFLSQSAAVTALGDIRVSRAVDEETSTVTRTAWSGDILAVMAQLILTLGLFALAIALLIRQPWSFAHWKTVVKKGARAYALFGVWLLWWLLARLGWIDGIFLGRFAEWMGEGGQIFLGVCTLITGTLNLGQTVRWSTPNPTWKRRLVSVGVLILVAVTAFEGMAWMTPERRHNWTNYWHHQTTPPYYWVYDPMIRRLNPWFIDMRFKRQDYPAVQSSDETKKTRVMVFGGSQTYGWGIPSRDKDAFSAKLQEHLHALGDKDIEVINVAFPGVKTATGLRWFSGNIIRYEPDIVVINFVVNEFMNVDQYHVWSNENVDDPANPEKPMMSPMTRTATGALLERFRGDILDSHLGQILAADIFEVYEMELYLKWWVKVAQEHNIRVVFSIEPTNMYVETAGKVIMRGESKVGVAQDIYRGLGETVDVPVYDVLNHFVQEQENLWFYDTMHMSRLGHRVFAENLANLVHCKILCSCDDPKCSECDQCKDPSAPAIPST